MTYAGVCRHVYEASIGSNMLIEHQRPCLSSTRYDHIVIGMYSRLLPYPPPYTLYMGYTETGMSLRRTSYHGHIVTTIAIAYLLTI